MTTTVLQTRKTMIEVSNMIVATMGNKFVSVGDDEMYLYKQIDGLHYYIHSSIEQDANNVPRIEYGVIRTNYKISKAGKYGHPKDCFYGYMKHCMPTQTRKNHIEEKLTDLTGVYPSQWYNRYEDERKGDYRFICEITEEQYSKKYKLPYGYELISGYDGKKKYIEYNGPDKVSIPNKQFDTDVDYILNKREIREKTIKALYRNTDLPLDCISQIMCYI